MQRKFGTFRAVSLSECYIAQMMNGDVQAAPIVSKRRILALAHAAATVLLVVWNGVSNSGAVFENTVGEISRRYETPFTPADYAFAIWGPIYLGLLAMAGFGIRRAFASAADASPGGRWHARSAFVHQLGLPFLAAQIVCGLWLWAWLTGAILISLLLMVTLWVLLMSCIVRLDMERWDAPFTIIAFVWWPMSLYSGWITVAMLANLSSYLASCQLAFVQAPGWAIALAGLLAVGNIALIWTRNMREFSAVAVWALIAVALNQEGPDASLALRWAAWGAAAAVFVSIAVHGLLRFTWPPSAR